VSEVVVRMPAALYQRLLERAAAEKRAPEEAVVEAVARWLDEEPVEERIRRALTRHGLLVPPEERRYAHPAPTDEDSLERDRQRVRQIMRKVSTPLSVDIIQGRE